MATETLRLLLPRMSEERESAMIQAVGAVANQPQPSLGKVVDYLDASEDPASKNLGAVLRSMSEMRLARLCFDPSGGERIDTAGWTTVFTLGGLTLPDVAISREDYSYEQRLSVALMYLVSQFARRLMHGLDRHLPKAIFLDEAWAITQTPEGAKLVPEVSRMGRSRNTALILVSQNAGDLLNEQVTNCLSSVYSFRSTERNEVGNVMALLGRRELRRAQGRTAQPRQRRVRLPRSRRAGRPHRRRPGLRRAAALARHQPHATRSPARRPAGAPDAHNEGGPPPAPAQRPARPGDRSHPGGPADEGAHRRRRREGAERRPRWEAQVASHSYVDGRRSCSARSAWRARHRHRLQPERRLFAGDHPSPEQYGSGIDGMVKPPDYPTTS